MMRIPPGIYCFRRWMRHFAGPTLVTAILLVIGLASLLILLDEGAPTSAEADRSSVPGPAVASPSAAKDATRLAAAENPAPGPGGRTDISARSAFTIAMPFQSIDAVTLKNGEQIVRLFGVEGPAAGDACTDGEGYRWACGLRARAALHNLLADKIAICQPRQAIGVGEIIASCRVATPRGDDMGDLAEQLVRAGWARPTPEGRPALGRFLEEAKERKHGLWRARWNADDTGTR